MKIAKRKVVDTKVDFIVRRLNDSSLADGFLIGSGESGANVRL